MGIAITQSSPRTTGSRTRRARTRASSSSDILGSVPSDTRWPPRSRSHGRGPLRGTAGAWAARPTAQSGRRLERRREQISCVSVGGRDGAGRRSGGGGGGGAGRTFPGGIGSRRAMKRGASRGQSGGAGGLGEPLLTVGRNRGDAVSPFPASGPGAPLFRRRPLFTVRVVDGVPPGSGSP